MSSQWIPEKSIHSSVSGDGAYYFFQGKPKWALIKSYNGCLKYSDLKKKLVDESTYNGGTIYWVKVSFIEELRPKKIP